MRKCYIQTQDSFGEIFMDVCRSVQRNTGVHAPSSVVLLRKIIAIGHFYIIMVAIKHGTL